MADRLAGKICLVTGGASGLGQAMVESFVREGAQVIFTDLDESLGMEVAGGLGPTALFCKQDVRDEMGWQSLIAMIQGQFGGLHVLVNNAGISRKASIEEETLDHWRAVQAVNVEGPFLGCKCAIPAMRAAGGGSIINITSTTFRQPLGVNPAYAASKGALDTLTRSVALYCMERGDRIRCNAIEPHAADTPLLRKTLAKLMADLPPEAIDRMKMQLGSAQAIADAAVFLASDESSEINGHALNLDRGARIVLAAGPT